MKHLILILSMALASCSVMDTSFYDDNESLLAVDVRMAVQEVDCNTDYTDSAAYLTWTIDRMSFYSESKGSKDVYALVSKMKETVKGIEASPAVCGFKKKLLAKQSTDIASAVMRRF